MQKYPTAPRVYPEIPLAQTVVRLCEEKGIQQIVISPGSRNAPLTKGFISHPFFETFSIVDERAAAFFALGLAQQGHKPVALVCTSGSALLNYYPAVAEAFYSDVPLVIISADRLPHRIDIGDGQTIRQIEVFEPHLEAAAYLVPDVSHATATLLESPKQSLLTVSASAKEIASKQKEIQKNNESQIHRVLNTALNNKGPVHLNVPLEEPLYGTTQNAIALHSFPQDKTEIKIPELAPFLGQWQKTKRKLVLVGVLPPDVLSKEIIAHLADDPSVLFLIEKTSNIKHQHCIDAIDSLIAPIESYEELLAELQPELLVTFGGMVVSKKIKAFLRNHPPKAHWHIDSKKAYDTYYVLSDFICCSPNYFFTALLKQKQEYVQSDYHQIGFSRYTQHRLLGINYLQKISFSDLKAFKIIFERLPKKGQLQLANSSTIRYAQLFQIPENLEVYCNRGTSGIDGSTATAVGAAWKRNLPTLLITGDLSFFYDANGLWNTYLRKDFRIILINNSGGGIFRILPGEKDTPDYDRYFETVHHRSAKQLCKDHGLAYRSAHTSWGLKRALSGFYRPSNRPKLLEIFTPRIENDAVVLNYFRNMNTNPKKEK